MRLRKGYIFRLLYLDRKSLISTVGSFFVVLLMISLVRLSMSCGNLASLLKDDNERANVNLAVYCLGTGLCSVIAFVLPLGITVMISDIKCRWNIFAKTIPMTAAEQSAHIYGLKLMLWCTALLLSFLARAVLGAVCGIGSDTVMAQVILVIGGINALISCYQPTALILLKKAGFVSLIDFAFSMISAALMTLGMMNYLKGLGLTTGEEIEEEQLDHILEILKQDGLSLLGTLAVAAPFVTAAVFGLFFFLMTKALERKEA